MPLTRMQGQPLKLLAIPTDSKFRVNPNSEHQQSQDPKIGFGRQYRISVISFQATPECALFACECH